jgi:hypothetical protein
LSANLLYSQLQWLPRPPQDVSQLLKSLKDADAPGSAFRSIAAHALDLNQQTKLAKAIDKARQEGRSLDPLIPFRLAVLSNATIDLIVPALIASAARHGIALEVIQPSYDQVAQEAFTPDSKVNTSNPDAVLFAIDYLWRRCRACLDTCRHCAPESRQTPTRFAYFSRLRRPSNSFSAAWIVRFLEPCGTSSTPSIESSRHLLLAPATCCST